MSLKRGDVLKVLENGVSPKGAHPIVILYVSGDKTFFSNITDIENEDFIHCVLEINDDSRILTLRSTFRYQSIIEDSVSRIELAIKKGNFRHCGQLADAAFNKIIDGSQLPTNVQIKPKYQKLLKPASAVVIPARSSLPAEA